MTSRSPLSASAFFYARSVNRGLASDYIDWATMMLEQGHDSNNLRMLAGLESDNTFEAQEHFKRAMCELNLSEPEPREAMRAYVCELTEHLTTGTLDPATGVRRLYDICVTAGYPRELMIWYQLDDALADVAAGSYPWCYPTLTVENRSQMIRGEASRFLEAFGCKNDI